MKSKRWRFVLATLAFCALGAGLCGYVINTRGARALAAYKRQLVASGEKLTVDELLPTPVPAERNGLTAFRNALAAWRGGGLLDTNPPPAMRMVKAGKAIVGWAQPVVQNDPSGGVNDWGDAVAAVAANEPGFEWLQQLIEQPTLDFQIDYRIGFNSIPIFHLPELKRAAQLSTVAALCDLHRGDAESATRRIRAELALVKAGREDRLVIAQLVRIAVAHLSLAATWEWLQSPALTDAQMMLVQRDWEELEFLQSTENALAMERVKGQELFESMRQSSAAFRQMAAPATAAGAPAAGPWYQQASAAALLKTKESLWRVALSYPDQLRCLQGQQALIDAVRIAARRRCFAPAFEQQQKQLAALGIKAQQDDSGASGWIKLASLLNGSISDMSVLPLERFIHRVYSVETARQIAITAIALKRYQKRHGVLPPVLADLVPEFLPEIPRDPMDGLPLRYRLKEAGHFVLYSIGDDGRDDGGDPASELNRLTFSWQRGHDLVWPQPATAEEVKAYFDSKPKNGLGMGLPTGRKN